MAVGIAPVDMIPFKNQVGNPDVVEPVPMYPKLGCTRDAIVTLDNAATPTFVTAFTLPDADRIDPAVVPTLKIGRLAELLIAMFTLHCAEDAEAKIDMFKFFVFEVFAEDAAV